MGCFGLSGDRDYLKPIGARLKEVREELRFKNRAQFAEAFGAPTKTYEKYEQGLSELPTLLLLWLQGTHRVNLGWLMSGEGSMFVGEEAKSTGSNPYNPRILARLGDIVELTYLQAGTPVPNHGIYQDAVELFGELLKTADMNDENSIDKEISRLRAEFKEQIVNAPAGSSKAAASGS